MANEVRKKYGTTVTYKDSGGDVTFTLQNLAAGAGRRSPSSEFSVDGYGPQGYYVRFILSAGFESAPVLGEMVALYAIEYGIGGSASSIGTNDDGNADGAVSSIDKLRNLKQLLVLQADEAAADIPMAAEAHFEDLGRHLAFAVWNFSSADNLQNTANTSYVEVTPYVYEIQ
jgi:hypothetical protein